MKDAFSRAVVSGKFMVDNVALLQSLLATDYTGSPSKYSLLRVMTLRVTVESPFYWSHKLTRA